MSYDLVFVPKTDTQSWEQALRISERPVGEHGRTVRPDPQAWAAVAAEAERLLGKVELEQDAEHFGLDHEPTGMEIGLYADAASITVPFWYAGRDAAAVIDVVYRLAGVIERHTGLTGYDAQLELAVAEAAGRPGLALAVFDQVARSFAQRGIASPSNNMAPKT
jgi:hypothetical protein